MNLKQMEYFVAAAEQLNFTRAAKKCFISQTAMTLQIRSLEEKIGVPLFVRDKHHVELTAAGKVYLNEARAILVRAEEAAKLARTAAEGVAGELTIGFIRGYEQSRFSETLRSFHEAYPNISIHLLRENMSALYQIFVTVPCFHSRHHSFSGIRLYFPALQRFAALWTVRKILIRLKSTGRTDLMTV